MCYHQGSSKTVRHRSWGKEVCSQCIWQGFYSPQSKADRVLAKQTNNSHKHTCVCTVYEVSKWQLNWSSTSRSCGLHRAAASRADGNTPLPPWTVRSTAVLCRASSIAYTSLSRAMKDEKWNVVRGAVARLDTRRFHRSMMRKIKLNN